MVGKRSTIFEPFRRYRYSEAGGSIKTYPQARDRVSLLIVVITSSTAAPLLISGGGGTSISNGSVVCIMFAFSCALSALFLLPTKPKAARLFRFAAIICLSSAILLFIFPLFVNSLS